MKRKFITAILILFLTNIGFSQTQFTQSTINDEMKRLPKPTNFYVQLVTKNEKPYKEVEITIDNKLIGITNDFGKNQFNLSNSGMTNLQFKKDGKVYTTIINFSQDSIYTINLKLDKPEFTEFKIKAIPLENLVYKAIENSKDNSLLNAFIFRFPNGKYKKEIEKKMENIWYDEANKQNTVSSYQAYLFIYPKGQYASKCKEGFDNALYTQAKQRNTMQAYKDYIDKSPYNFHKQDAEQLAYKIAQNKNTKSAYSEYKNLFVLSSQASNASSAINNINQQVAREEEDRIFKNAQNGDISDCDSYLNTYPSGKYVSQVKERLLYLDIKYADKVSEFDRYLNKYPNGEYYSDIKDKKETLTKKLERERKIKANSNINKWQLGYKVCRQDYRGIVMGTLEQWNGNKTRAQIKIAASPGGLTDEGDKLTKGNMIWINPKKGWHLCLPDEKEYALSHDKSDDFEKYVAQQKTESQNTKKGKFEIGERVTYHVSKAGTYFGYQYTTYNYYIKGVVTNWNSNYTKMEVEITDADGGFVEKINGQSIYEGHKIWVSPYGWK